MSHWRCKSCKGEYTDPLPDGTRYFHVCPPLVDPETGDTKSRQGHRDERPQEILVTGDQRGYTVTSRAGEVLASRVREVEVPMRSAGSGREKIK